MSKAPVFIKIKEYKEVLDIVDVIKNKIEQAKATLAKVNRLKDEEDRQLAEWNENLSNLTSKLDNIDKMLFEPDE